MNRITLYGNLGNSPEIQTIGDKKLAKFSLATTRRGKDKDGNKITDWHRIVLWDKLAELAEKYLTKGSSVIIEGEVQYGNYTNKEGIMVYTTDIVGNQMHFTGKKKQEPSNALTDKQGVFRESDKPVDVEKNETPGSDELSDLPFIFTIPIALGVLMQFML